MTGRSSLAIWLVAATVFMVAAFVLSFRWLGSSSPGDPNGGASSGEIVLQDVELRGRAASEPSWRVRASQITLARDRRAGTIKGLHDGLFYDHRQPVASFAADRLSYQDAALGPGGVLEMTGNIHVRSRTLPFAPAPVDVKTSLVRFRIGDHRVICPQPVRASIGTLGAITTQTLMLDTQTHSIEAGPVLVVADATNSPLPSLSAASSGPDLTTDAKTSNKVTFSAPEGGRWDDPAQTLYLTGPVTFKQGAATVTTTGAVYHRRTKTANSESPVTITDETSIVTGDHGIIDFGSHTATLAGNVHMSVRPKPAAPGDTDPDADARKPTTLTCQQIIYDYRAKQARTAGKVVIRQTDRTVTADSGLYNVKTQIADLNGNVVATSTDGKILRAPSATISTEKGKEWVEVRGAINGEFPDTDGTLDASPQATKSASVPKSSGKPAKP